MTVRPTLQADLAALRQVVDDAGLFPGEMLADMASGFLSGTSGDLWLTCEVDGRPVGFCYAVPEMLTNGAWNIYALAVAPSLHRQGYGQALVSHLEQVLRRRDQRILIVETSSEDGFASAREFYRRNGYTEEARIRDFWAAGDDKIVFWKSFDQVGPPG